MEQKYLMIVVIVFFVLSYLYASNNPPMWLLIK